MLSSFPGCRSLHSSKTLLYFSAFGVSQHGREHIGAVPCPLTMLRHPSIYRCPNFPSRNRSLSPRASCASFALVKKPDASFLDSLRHVAKVQRLYRRNVSAKSELAQVFIRMILSCF